MERLFQICTTEATYTQGKLQGLSVVVQEIEGTCGLFLQHTKYPCLPSSLLGYVIHSHYTGEQLCHLCLRNKYTNKHYTPIARHQFHLSCYFYNVKTLEKGPEEMMKTHRTCMRCFSVLSPQPDGLSWYIPADTA